jgi:hypothetical protein
VNLLRGEFTHFFRPASTQVQRSGRANAPVTPSVTVQPAAKDVPSSQWSRDLRAGLRASRL